MKIFIFVWLMLASAALNAGMVLYGGPIADINSNEKKEIVLFADQTLMLRDAFGNNLTIPEGKQRLEFTKLLVTYKNSSPWSSWNGELLYIEAEDDFVRVGFGKRQPKYKFNLIYIDGVNVTPAPLPLPRQPKHKFNLIYIDGVNVTPAAVPLPASGLLLLSGILGTVLVGRKRQRGCDV